MDHEKLALISPALLDRMLNHLSGGDNFKPSENHHIPDTNIHKTLLDQNIHKMNTAMDAKPVQLKNYQTALQMFRSQPTNANLENQHEQENNDEVDTNLTGNVKEQNKSKENVKEQNKLKEFDSEDEDEFLSEGDEEQFDDLNAEKTDNLSPTKSVISDYGESPARPSPKGPNKFRAQRNIEKGLTGNQRYAVNQIVDVIKQSNKVINVDSSGQVEIYGKPLLDSHAKDLYTAIVSNRKSKELPNGAIEFANALVQQGLPYSVIKDDRIRKEINIADKYLSPSNPETLSPSKRLKWLERD